MTTQPEISVVMGVHNEAERVERSVNSILNQACVDLELIIVDDGSTDLSLSILNQIAGRDRRVTIITQAKGGLTKALIRGCEAAKGMYIARQDAGDISLPSRLKQQLDRMNSDHRIALCSTGVETIAPDGECLFTTIQAKQDASKGLTKLDIKTIQGPPHHGSTMFRASLYRTAGGYRSKFIVAQDLDLWCRLTELGKHVSIGHVLYVATLDKNSISSTKRIEQLATTVKIIECNIARRELGTDANVLRSMPSHTDFMKKRDRNKHTTHSDFYYFVGSNLKKREPKASRKYFKLAILENPFNLKAWIKLIT